MPLDKTKMPPDSLKLLFQILIELFKLEKPPTKSGLASKFLCSMIWIATGLIPSSVNLAFACYRKNQREIIRHLKMFLFHPFRNIWYFLSDILSDILSDTLSDSCSAASDYLRQTWYHCSFGFTRKSLKCLANIACLLKIHDCPIREFWSNLTKTTTRRWLSDNFKQLNSSLKEHFGEKFVVLSCLFHLSLL